jgi:hypothetical protein
MEKTLVDPRGPSTETLRDPKSVSFGPEEWYCPVTFLVSKQRDLTKGIIR